MAFHRIWYTLVEDTVYNFTCSVLFLESLTSEGKVILSIYK